MNPARSELLADGWGAGYKERRLWAIALPSGSSRPVTEFDVSGACWSPDGTRVAFARGEDLFLVSRDGGKPVKLATFPGGVGGPRWSPSWKALRVVLSKSRAETQEIWEVDADGTRPHRLLAGWYEPAHELMGTWTSDGAWFVFASVRDDHSDVWAINEKRSIFLRASREPVQLTRGPLDFREPLLSRDCKRLFASGSQGRAELVRYDSKRREFVSYLGGIWAVWVSFSRDKRWVAYEGFPEKVLWRMRPDGSQKLQLTFPPGVTDGGAWSPNGKRIACRIKRPGKH